MMKNLLAKIDTWLLPRNLQEKFSPYVWLIYLPLFFVPVFIWSTSLFDQLATVFITLGFLAIYFHVFWVTRQQVIYHIIALLILGTIAAFVTPTANSLFIYAGAFCSRLKPIKYAFSVLFGILLWIALISWLLEFEAYFYWPGLTITLIVGLLNIYQFALHESKQALILSRNETKRLAQVAERERIARDLHDLIGHTFSVITLKADLAGRLLDKGLDKDLAKARGEIKQLEEISRDALSQVREVVSGYRTGDLLSELANAKNVLFSLEIDFNYRFENIEEQQIELDQISSKTLAIVLRELVTNVIKHADATRVNVCIKQADNSLILTMQDNGKGFDNSQQQGFGIQGIQERVQGLGGFVHIESGEGGTSSEIAVPMETENKSNE